MKDNQALQQSANDFFSHEVVVQCEVIRAVLTGGTHNSDDRVTSLSRALSVLNSAARLTDMELAVLLIASMQKLPAPGTDNRKKHNKLWNNSLDALLLLSDTPNEQVKEYKKVSQLVKKCIKQNQAAINPAQTDSVTPLHTPANPQGGMFCEHTPENIDPAMLELYRIECQRHGDSLISCLDAVSGSQMDSKTDAKMSLACKSIRSAALLVFDQPLADLAVKLQEQLNSFSNSASKLTGKTLESLRRISYQLSLADSREELPDKAYKKNMAQSSETVCPGCHNTSDNHTDLELPDTPLFEVTTRIDESILDLFLIEIETHSETLSSDLLSLEKNHNDSATLDRLMRASHSIKGAARMVGTHAVVGLAHAMEDYFVALQEGHASIHTACINVLLGSLDYINHIALLTPRAMCNWPEEHRNALSQLIYRLKLAAQRKNVTGANKPVKTVKSTTPALVLTNEADKNETHSSFVRIDAGHLDTMMGLSGELLVGSRWIGQHTDELVSLKQQHNLLIQQLGQLRDSLDAQAVNDTAQDCFQLLEQQAESCRTALTERLNDVEDFDRRTHSLTDRLNHEVIAGRMRPFGEGTQGFARMVRDLAQELGKRINLVIVGENTQVDRDILERIEAPLNHMLRNAVDHGIESPSERLQAGKSETGTIKLRAYHNAGMLSIDVIDDGRGVDLTALRNRIVEHEMITARVADELNESELLDFLYLPGFSTRDDVTEISGRGVGLDVVHSTIQELRGQIRSSSTIDEGLSIHLQLPLTLSVIRTLLVELDNESYAFPMTRIDHIIKIEPDQIDTLAGKQFISVHNQAIGLVHAAQIFGLKQQPADNAELSVVIISDRNCCYGVVVDRLLGEKELAIRALDERLGKIQDISAAAVLEDGQPTLIVDIDDMLRSIEKLSSRSVLQSIKHTSQKIAQQSVKRILVVDDSLTVREAERKMIEARGYQVELAVDGMDGWNTFREGNFDLVVSDIDMPRMNGIAFISLIKQDETYRDTPVMIVSYKDREEDRMLGLEAGADYYLTKGSFHDESLLDAINDLIGPA